MKNFLILAISLVISNYAFSCDLQLNGNTKEVVSSWLGNSSEFSKAYKTGKCALDEALNKLSASQRRVIANLIAKSYSFTDDKNNTKKLLTYNY